MSEVYRFRVTLLSGMGRDYERRQIFRDIEIRGKSSLYKLADTIQKYFGEPLSHAFCFHEIIGDPYKEQVKYSLFADLAVEENDDFFLDDNEKSVKNTKIADVFKEGKEMGFLFDYGEDWMYRVECKKVKNPVKGKRYPQHVGGKRELYFYLPDED